MSEKLKSSKQIGLFSGLSVGMSHRANKRKNKATVGAVSTVGGF